MLRYGPILQPLPELLLNGVFVLFLQAELLLNDLQLLLKEVLPVRLLDLLFNLSIETNRRKIKRKPKRISNSMSRTVFIGSLTSLPSRCCSLLSSYSFFSRESALYSRLGICKDSFHVRYRVRTDKEK